MLDKMTNRLDFHGNALMLRAERQRAIASNIANADTPGYVARDFSFGDAMRQATGSGVTRLATGGSVGTSGTSGTSSSTLSMGATSNAASAAGNSDARHIPLPGARTGTGAAGGLGYTVQTQPSLDNNTGDLDRERANFVDNSVRYEATLRFINGNAKTMLSAIQGQ